MQSLRKNTTTKNTASSPMFIYAKFRGVCKCGRGFIAGEQIEFDPSGRQKRCVQCAKKRASHSGIGQLIDFDSYSGVVQRLKRIDSLPRPLAPHIAHEYWKLMQEISTAPESSKSVTSFLQSTARCCNSSPSERYVVSLLEERQCVHCLQMQSTGDLVLMDFPSRNVHCIWCECTNV